MSSFRTRLTLAFALVAVVPLALAMLLFSRRIQSTVSEQANERLSSALAGVEARLTADGQLVGERLALLADDAQLKRLYLVPGIERAELRQYLADQRFLLGLDYLWVADSSGVIVADAAFAATNRAASGGEPLASGSLTGAEVADVAGASVGVARVAGSPALALDASASILYVGEAAGRVRGGVLLDSTFLAGIGRASGVELLLTDATGRVAARTRGVPSEADAAPLRAGRVVMADLSFLARSVRLPLGAEPRARITAFASTTAADRTLAALRTAALLLSLLGVALAVLLGTLWSAQISRPVERLAEFSERMARGDWDEPLAIEGVRELHTLIDALERMRHDLREYRTRLRAGERQAAYGQMARQLAHEIKNPLTPIAVSVADLQRSYAARLPDFGEILDQAARTVGEEVQRLKRLLADFNELGRFPAPRPAPLAASTLAADLTELFRVDVAASRLRVSAAGDARLEGDRDQLRQALINLVQNALDATAAGGAASVTFQAVGGALEIRVSDDGPGLTGEQQSHLFVPGFTTKPQGSGIGLALVERIVTDHGGTIGVQSAPGRGTAFVLRLPLKQGD